MYRPYIVVVTLCSNDFCDDDTDLSRELILASGETGPFVRGLARHGYFATPFAFRRMDNVARNRLGMAPELLQWSDSEIPLVEVAWARTLDCIRASRDFFKARGIKFLAVYLGSDVEAKYFLDPGGTVSRLKAMRGSHKDVSWDFSRSIKRVTSYCDTQCIPWFHCWSR